jgi:hypothetical protein
MRVLFLDIDGVLNSVDNMLAQANLWHIDNKNKSRDEFGHLFDERCVKWLNYIIYKTGCKIVISSTWRHSGLEAMKLMWEMRDLPGEIIGCTPNEVSESIINLYAATNNEADRGYEIQEWIDTHKPEKYCIVDDENDMLSHQNFVRTNSEFGLDCKTAHSIITILNAN